MLPDVAVQPYRRASPPSHRFGLTYGHLNIGNESHGTLAGLFLSVLVVSIIPVLCSTSTFVHPVARNMVLIPP